MNATIPKSCNSIAITVVKKFSEDGLILRGCSWLFFLSLFLITIYYSCVKNDLTFLGALGAVLGIAASHIILITFTIPDLLSKLNMPCQYISGCWHYSPSGISSDIINEESALILNGKYETTVNRKFKILIGCYVVTIVGSLMWALLGLKYT